MTNTKEQLATAVEALPDTVPAAALIYADAGGKVVTTVVNASVPLVVQMLGLATSQAGQALVRAG